jgi:hypothetical protein
VPSCSPFFLCVLPLTEAGQRSGLPPFYYKPLPHGYDFLVIHLRHRRQRKRLGVLGTRTVTRQSSHHQVDPPLGDIGVGPLLQDGRIAVHERLVLVDRDVGRQVAQG